jgi:hypothetical protein
VRGKPGGMPREPLTCLVGRSSTDSMRIHHSKTVNNSYCGGEFLLQMFE